MASEFEARVRHYQKEIVNCIKEPTIVSQLEAASILTSEQSSRIKNRYIYGENHLATEDLLDCLYQSDQPGKWKSFQDALDSAEYEYLKNLLLNPESLDSEFAKHARAIMRIFTPFLERILQGEDFIAKLYAKNIINERDLEIIRATCARTGSTYSTIVMLERMKCRVSPEKWYFEFLDLLANNGYENIVKEMEPAFLSNPSAYRPQFEPIYTDGKGRVVYNREQINQGKGAVQQVTDAQCSIREHVVEEHLEAEEDTNDLGSPPTPPMRQDSLPPHEDMYISERLEELNIKPDITNEVPDGEIKQSNIDGGDVESSDSDSSSSENMDSDFENTEVKSTGSTVQGKLKLRNYQLELAENAVLGRNTIICAETGSGKTWVALHIIKKHLQNATNGPRKVIFMARTGALIKQQADRFKEYLPEYQTKLISGEDDESRMLHMFLEDFDILCFTPQILVNNLEENVIESLSVFSLLILDECHHTKGDGPYNTLMRKYLIEKDETREEMPQVVGLTASIGVDKSRTDAEAVDYILRVCACLDVTMISTVERNVEELRRHTNMPSEETIPLRKQDDEACVSIIISAMEETEELLQDNALMQPDMIDMMEKQPRNRESQEYNKWTIDVMNTAMLSVSDNDMCRDIRSCAMYLNTYNSALEVNKLLLTTDVIRYMAEKHRQDAEHKQKLTQFEKILFAKLQEVQKQLNVKGRKTENPNVRILSDTLRKMLEEKGDDSRAMVFVKARATCKSLASFLDKDLNRYGVRAKPLWGKENRGGDDGMTQAMQTETLDRFRDGTYKVLVCTSVGNEGIDVPDCNIVLSYEYSGDEITKIQMKGRARKKAATTITMGSEKVVEQERLNAYKAAMMYRALNKVKECDPKLISTKVKGFQREEAQKYKYKKDIERLKKGRKSDEDYEVLCRRCNTLACYVSDVRQLGHDHIVIDKTFPEKIHRKEHKRPKTYNGIHKKYKMYCNKCPLDWGIIGIRDGLECMILKIQNFKFRNLRTQSVSFPKKWIDMPYTVLEIQIEDLPRLLG